MSQPAVAGATMPMGIRPLLAKLATAARPGTSVPAAGYVGVGTTLFDELVRQGRMPKPFKVNSRTLWDRHKLDASIDVLSDQDDDPNPWDGVAA